MEPVLTLRDFFAAHAPQREVDGLRTEWLFESKALANRTECEARFAYADKMLAARKAKP